jgi:HEAT repeat protein
VDARGRAAELCLRRLGLAIKTTTLYPLPHPSAARALTALVEAIRAYGEAYGAFAARVGKRAFFVEGTVYEGGAHANLAFHMFSRKIARIEIEPAVSEDELTGFLGVAGMDRAKLEEAGGARHLMWQSGVRNVRVAEIALEHEVEIGFSEAPADIDPDLLAARRVAPADREQILEILRSGPREVAQLINRVYARTTGGGTVVADEDSRVLAVYQAVTNLDRLIMDEPFEEQEALRAHLAEAHLHVEEPLRKLLGRVLIGQVADGGPARDLVEHLSGEHLDQIIQESLGPGNLGDQLGSLFRGLTTDPGRGRTTLSILEARLRPAEVDTAELADAIWSRGRAPATVRETTVPQEFQGEVAQGALRQQEIERLRREIQGVDEQGVARDVILTLVDLLHAEADAAELVDVADDLAEHLGWLVEQREFAVLARILERLKQTVASGYRRADLAAGVLKRITENGAMLDRLLSALWAGRDTPEEQAVRACLQALSAEAIGPLVRVLGLEPRAGMRALLCDLLVQIGREHVEEIGAFATDSRWYLVRNIVNVLGRLQHPQALPLLQRLTTHREYRVRREVVDALAGIATEEARTVLAALLEDPDERIQLRTVRSVGAWGGGAAIPRLVALLGRPDPLHRAFALKREVIQTLERLAVPETLPALKTVANGRLVLRPRSRELQRLAQKAIEAIEGQR